MKKTKIELRKAARLTTDRLFEAAKRKSAGENISNPLFDKDLMTAWGIRWATDKDE